MNVDSRLSNRSRSYLSFTALLLGLLATSIGWTKSGLGHQGSWDNPACKDGCVIVEQLGEYEVVTAISPRRAAMVQQVVRKQGNRQNSEGIKCSLKSDCVIVDEPDFTTCGVTRVNCVEIFDRGSYDIIVTWSGLGLDPDVQIRMNDEEAGGDENDE